MTDRPTRFFGFNVNPWGLLTSAGVIACLATCCGFLGRFHWFLDLFSHFRVQYLIGLLVLGIIFLIGSFRKTAAIMLLFACVNLALVLPLYFSEDPSQEGSAPCLRVMLINVNTRLGDPDRVRNAISGAAPDILILEEISSRWMAALTWLTNTHPYALSEPRDDNFGIGLFSRLPMTDAEVVYIGAAEVPSIVVTITTPETNLQVIATHPVPPIGREYSALRDDQLNMLPDYVNPTLPVLLVGDLNATPWSFPFRQLLDHTGLRDSAKGHGVQPTWPNNNFFLRVPIDHCLHSSEIIVTDRRIGEDVSSDHYPLIVDFKITGQKQHLE